MRLLSRNHRSQSTGIPGSPELVRCSRIRYRQRSIMRHLLAFITALFLSSTLDAQVRADLSSNVDHQPMWGPTGYDRVEYYYLPDIEVYYSVALHRFSYNERGYWISRPSLPSRCREYDLYTSYKVVVNEPAPYRNHKKYKEQFSSYKGRRDQQAIRDSRDPKYFVNNNHPEHHNWVMQQRSGTGNGGGRGHGR